MKSSNVNGLLILFLLLLVSACSGGGGAGGGGTGGETTDTVAPSVPTGLAATATSANAIDLSWNASTDNVAVAGYKVYRAGVEVGSAATNAYSDAGLASSTTYAYTVAAYDGANNTSAQSGPVSATTLALATGASDTTTPYAPANLTATAVNANRIDLAWSASEDDVGVTGYEIWLDNAKIATVTGVTYSDTGIVPGTSCTYTIKAFDAAGNVSAASAPATAMTPAINLARTGQTACYDSAGLVIPCANTGQDGDLKKGEPWPGQRFTVNGDGTLTDALTGLAWAPSGNVMLSRDPSFDTDSGQDGQVWWVRALLYMNKLNTENYLGHNDWRLPNRKEIKSLTHYGVPGISAWLNTQGFTSVQAAYYWSSTSFVVDPIHAWYSSLNIGYLANDDTKDRDFYVWPVRDAQTTVAAPAALPDTGQVFCYDTSGIFRDAIPCAATGQDGELQKGEAWPDPRFTNNNGTMRDNLTGLIWARDGNAPGPAACAPGAAKTWDNAFSYVSCLNANSYLGHADWRLPNINELESLVHAGLTDSAAWLNAHGFVNAQGGFYWSSTTHAANTGDAWIVHVLDGDVFYNVKSNSFFVWPVRGGQ